MYEKIDYLETMYKHHIDLYQQRRFTISSGLFNLEIANMYAYKLMELNCLTKEQHLDNLLPFVDFAELFGTKGSLAADGIE